MAEEPRHPRFWQTVPGILTAIAAVITAVTGLLVALRPEDTHRANLAPSGDSRPAITRAREPRETVQEPSTVSDSSTRDVIVVFRNGSQQTLDKVAFEPQTKVCTAGVDIIRAIEKAGGIPFVLPVREREEALREGICEARTLSPSER